MSQKNIRFKFEFFLAVLFLYVPAIYAQFGYYFGQNKVHYQDFDWSVLQTEHFDVYYYIEEKFAALDAARMAERGYAYLSDVLDYRIEKRIPLILYASLNDFQQTNVVQDIMDQSTRGVTEGLKNRVVIPLTGSYREFNHVLVHEMVHAFQFDMILHSRFANPNFNPPLWFVEGMAEYLSIGMDDVTRMWVRDGLLQDDLLTIDKLNSTYDIRIYRLGQSVWHYLSMSHGKQIVGKLFKAAVQLGSIDSAMKKLLKLDSKELSERWHHYVKTIVMPKDSTLQTPEQVAKKITYQAGYYHRMNLVPAVSPNGEKIAYIANKDLKEDIYLLTHTTDGDYEEQKLISGSESKRFETLRYLESSISWSRDGDRIAFISKSGQDDAIYIIDPNTKEIQKKFVFDQLNALQSPAFSTDGNHLAFVGIQEGISDLYILDLTNQELKRLTNDRYAVLHPQWSPNDKSIVFVTDLGTGTDIKNLLFGDYDLALYHLSDNQLEMLTDLPGNAISPQWSPDGKTIAFVSNHQGIYNIYKLNLVSRKITTLTRLKNDVLGITETTPALSWSYDGSTMVFSSFYQKGWHLYRMEVTQTAKLVESSVESTFMHTHIILLDSTLLLPEMADLDSAYQNYPLEEENYIIPVDYNYHFKLDYISVGGGYDTYYGGVGQAQLGFSDMMGNHNVYVTTQTQFSDLLHSDLGLAYINLGNRLYYGIQAFQANAYYAALVGYNFTQYLRYTYRGFNSLASYPFNRFFRIEFSGGLTWVDADWVTEEYRYSGLNRTTDNLKLYKYAQFGTAIVFDNTVYGPIGPFNGSRSRLSVETAAMDFQFTNFYADYRRYHNMGHRSVIAWRFLGAASLGKDEQVFSIGGPYSYRGTDYDELYGTQFIISNLEYRFPLLPFLSPKFDFLNVAVFYDMAAAWGLDAPGYSTEKFQPFSMDGGFHFEDLNSAVGVGIRFNIGYFLLQYDVAWPTDLRKFGDPVKKFSIGTYF